MLPYYLYAFICLLITYMSFKFLTKNHDYWESKNVPYAKPKPLFGNFFDYIILRKSSFVIATAICKKFPEEPYIGVFFGTEPALIIKDPKIIKLVLVKDFYYFHGREITDYANCETITKNLFFNGGNEWKVFRQNLTPLFTSAKLKLMFPLIIKCANDFEKYIDDEVNSLQFIDGKSLLTRFTMECIINCAFGISANTLKNSDTTNPFFIMKEKIFSTSITTGLKTVIRAMWPNIFYGLRFRLFDDKIETFFHEVFDNVCAQRSYKKSSRNDFIDSMMTWKNNTSISGNVIDNLKTGENKEFKIEANDDLLVSQCILFFGAGFESTSTSVNFMLFELAKCKNAQDNVIKEIDDYLKENNGNIEYDCVNKLPYTEACLEETLRLYPALGTVTREVMDDYTLPTGLHLQRGLRIQIPVHYIHTNPEYFEDPHEFRPERMLGDEKKNIIPFTFMPFGEGPRTCIGARFAKMTLYPCLIKIFKNHRIELADTTLTKLDFKAATIATQAVQVLEYKFIRRQ